MKHIVLAVAAAAGIVAASPAFAQAIYSYPPAYPAPAYLGRGYPGPGVEILSPREVMAMVRQQGFDPVSRPVWRPGRYVMVAVDPRGREFRVVADARGGDIIRAVPLNQFSMYDAPRRYEPYPQPAPYPPTARPMPAPPPGAEMPDDGDEDLPPPSATPHVIPGPRSAAPSPSRSAAITPPSDMRTIKPGNATAPLKPQGSASTKTPLPRNRPTGSLAAVSTPSQKAETAKPAEPAKLPEPPVSPLEDATPTTPRF